MGLLIEHTPHLDVKPPWHELAFALSARDGEAYEQLTLEQRDEVYQAVLDAIRSRGVHS